MPDRKHLWHFEHHRDGDDASPDDPSLDDTWTQAKSMMAVPDGEPSQFQEFLDDLPHSHTEMEFEGGEIEPETAELPSTAMGAGMPEGLMHRDHGASD